MDLKEVASLLGLSREMAKLAIDEGIKTRSGNRVRLRAVLLPTGPDVAEPELDAFIKCLEADDPGRYPPVTVRRELLIECGYRCAVCKGDAPLDFHHILDWAAIKHHDAQHMLAVCSNCHAKITRFGQPDSTAQKEIKRRLKGEYAAAVEAIARAAATSLEAPVRSSAPRASLIEVPRHRSGRPIASSRPLPSQEPAIVDASAMKQIFAREVTYQGPSDDVLLWVSERLFSTRWDSDLSRNIVLLLRTLRAITEIQAAVHPESTWTTWTYTDRLVDATANVLAEIDVDPLAGADAATTALADARECRLLQFEDVDEWQPGMASGSGWVEKVTLSRIGEKILRKLDV